MALIDALKKFFSSPCRGCLALDRLVEEQREQIKHLRYQEEAAQLALRKLIRIEPISGSDRTTQPTELKPVAPKGENWSTIKKKLELKSKRSPEDQVADYWKNKAETLEQEVGLKRPEVIVDDLARDIKDLEAS